MGDARQELIAAVYDTWASRTDMHLDGEMAVDAILANPDVVLRALGGVQTRAATTRIGTIETWTVTFETLGDAK